MTRSTLLDRLNQELEAFGKKAQAALDEGKLQIEQMRVRRRRDHTARDLGLLLHRRERTGQSEPARMESLLARLDELEAELAQLEVQVTRARQQRPGTGTTPSQDASATSAAPPPAAEPAQPASGAAGAPGAASAAGAAGGPTG